MRITTDSEFDKLISDHFEQLKIGNSVIAFMKLGKPRAEFDMNDFSKLETNIKYFCFLTSSFLDLLVALKALKNAKTKWEILFNLKYCNLIVYEAINTYNLYSKSLTYVIRSNFITFIPFQKQISSLFKDFKRNFNLKQLEKVRNKCAGHFDEDFSTYFKVLESIDYDTTVLMAEKFLDFLKVNMLVMDKIADEWQKRAQSTKK